MYILHYTKEISSRLDFLTDYVDFVVYKPER